MENKINKIFTTILLAINLIMLVLIIFLSRNLKDLNNEIDTLDREINNIANHMLTDSYLEVDIDGINKKLNTLNTEMTYLRSDENIKKIPDIIKEINWLSSNIGIQTSGSIHETISDKIKSITTKTGYIYDLASSNSTDISTIISELENIKNEVESLSYYIDDNTREIESVKLSIGTLYEEINSLSWDVNNLASTIRTEIQRSQVSSLL